MLSTSKACRRSDGSGSRQQSGEGNTSREVDSKSLVGCGGVIFWHASGRSNGRWRVVAGGVPTLSFLWILINFAGVGSW